MDRPIVDSEEGATLELRSNSVRPEWLQRDVALPFSKLTGGEFEVLCFLLLRAQYTGDKIYYYGKTADMGRDIVHHLADGRTRLIQCKNYSSPPNVSAIRSEMAKVYLNVHSGKIPLMPDEVVFFVSTDLSSSAQDLIQFQDKWREVAEVALKQAGRLDPSAELMHFASTWWPFGDRQAEIALTESIRAHKPELIDEFFSVRKVIDASREQVRQDMRDELKDHLSVLQYAAIDSLPPRPDLSAEVVRIQLSTASRSLSKWPQTLGGSFWLDRSEAITVLDCIRSSATNGCILLGDPGTGKSALLAHIYDQLTARGIACLGIKADTLDVNVDSLGKLAERLLLPAPVADCVEAIARSETVVVLIDQLDALADLVDLRSQRLSVLLSLVHQLSQIPNVFVVASSRAFEFHHDSRLRTIGLEELTLTLPTWEAVSHVLDHYQLDSTHWPETFRDILRAPHNLKLFVEHLAGTSEVKVFDSYQQMLEAFWYKAILHAQDADAKSQFLSIISHEMSHQEVLWLPLARFDNRRMLIDQLVAAGVLAISENGMQFGFQHQTLYSHALARAMVQDEVDLFSHVKARQHAIFIRPTLWVMLGYLRVAAPHVYEKQMERLCGGELRLHVQHLLLDFLGRLDDPSHFEESLFVRWLNDNGFRRRALLAIAHSEGWFQRLKGNTLDELVSNPRGAEWQLTLLLSNGIAHSREATVSLLRTYWLNDANNDRMTFRILESVREWTPAIVEIVCHVIQRTPIQEMFITGVAAAIAVNIPERAPHLLAIEFRRQLKQATAAADRHARMDGCRKVLESSSGRYQMPNIAAASPAAFLTEMWPLFIEALQPTLDKPHYIVNRFRQSYCLSHSFNAESALRSPLLESMEVAIQAIGRSDPEAFGIFVRSNWSSDAMVVQRLLCRGLVGFASPPLDLALQFLSRDPRSLQIGDFEDSHSDSITLIEKLSPYLNPQQLQQLDAKIGEWSEYHANLADETADLRRVRIRWDRQGRLRLRKAIPKNRMPISFKAALEAEEIALAEPAEELRKDHTFSSQLVRVKSPMSTEQMQKAADSHILKLFDELTDETSWEYARASLRGGTVEASRALAELAKREPNRAARIAKRLRATDQQITASHVLEAICQTDYSTADLFGLIRELIQGGFGSKHFQHSVAVACLRRSNDMDGLPADIAQQLKAWLAGWKYELDEDFDEGSATTADDERRSIVFDRSASYAVPHDTYSLLKAIAFGLMRRNPPSSDEWLDVLEGHLLRRDKTRIWQIHLLDLRMLSNCDHARAVRILRKLFNDLPSVFNSEFTVHLMAEIRLFLGEHVFADLCEQLGMSHWALGQQAQGELLGISFIAGDAFTAINERVEQAIALHSQEATELLRGIAFSAANLWRNPSLRSMATDVIVTLARRDVADISSALSAVFLTDKFTPNTYSRRILETAARHPLLVRKSDAYHFAEMLEWFAPAMPDTVISLANALLDQLECEPDDQYRRNLDMADSALTSIAVTLQRMDEHRRLAGLDLFERMLRLGFSATIAAVHELDNRPLGIPQRVRQRGQR